MNGLEYEILVCDIKIINVKLEKLHIEGSKLLLEKPPFFFFNKKKRWKEKLDKLFEKELDMQTELINKYKKVEEMTKK